MEKSGERDWAGEAARPGPGGPGVAPLCSGHYFLPAAGYVNVSGSLASSSFELAAK